MDIPSRYNSAEIEPKILDKWLKGNYFNADVNSNKQPFCIVIPPPNITGILHMGHALNNTLQDVLIRFHRLKSEESLWMPGTDHAGIATQNVLEKKLAKENIKKEDIGRDEFIKQLWQWRDSYGSTIIDQLKKLGSSCDWRRTRFTMDPDYSDAVKEVFVNLYNKGLIYRGNYIINWCPRCKTALSDEEAARKEIDGYLYYIKYPVKGSKKYIVVATTRPETMLGDTAIAINPNDKRYNWLKGKAVILPVVERELKVIEDLSIDPEFGTGVVKVTPAHDPVDFSLGKKYNLDFIDIMNDDATLNNNVPEYFKGKDRFIARKLLLELLGGQGLIEKKDKYSISAGHCYRCQTIVEPRISLQWFVKMQPLALKAIEVVEKNEVKFHPQRWEKVYLNWMKNIQDWCISRQIWWGHQIPVWYCQKCQNQSTEPEENASTKGIIVSKAKPDGCPDCGSKNLIQDTDVLDTWFSSWLWPFATLGWPKQTDELKYFYPTNCLITASEILFFWVARMIMSGIEFMGQIPFKDVLIHGTVRDIKGIKMSKSLGNIIDPLDIIEKFGADALRFSLMLLAASGSDVYLSDDKFLVGRNFSNKIWNAARFILLKLENDNLEVSDLELKNCDDIDNWILNKLNTAIEEISTDLNTYSLNDAAKKIYDFFWHVFCDWYIEITKNKLDLNRSKILIFILLNSIKLLHPFMPFITEEVFRLIKTYTRLPLGDTIMKSGWPSKCILGLNSQKYLKIDALFETIKEIRNIKVDLGLGQKKVVLEVSPTKDNYKLWKENKVWIKRITISEEILIKDKLERVLYKNDYWSINLGIETVDMGKFLTSLDKKVNNLESALGKTEKRLNNKGFCEKAASDVIMQEKNKFTSLSNNINRIKELRNAFK